MSEFVALFSDPLFWLVVGVAGAFFWVGAAWANAFDAAERRDARRRNPLPPPPAERD